MRLNEGAAMAIAISTSVALVACARATLPDPVITATGWAKNRLQRHRLIEEKLIV